MGLSKEPRKAAPVTSLGARRAPAAAKTGHAVGMGPDGFPLVEFEGNTAGPLPARLLAPVDLAALPEAIREPREVLLLFDGGDPLRPIIAGVLASSLPRPVLVEGALPSLPDSAEIDGRRVRIEGQEEIVLCCGEASITLRRNGKVVIRGVQVESSADGINRVKGSNVNLG